MFSALRERKLRFALVWKAWTKRCVRITRDGILSYSRPSLALSDPTNEKCPRHKQFLLDEIEVTLMADEDVGASATVEYGLVVKCHTLDHVESYFRCILSEQEVDPFLALLRQIATKHNITDNRRDIMQKNLETIKKRRILNILRSNQSVMRRAVSLAMDRYDQRSRRERILAKRGAFHYLPVLLSNDLIHGSWWFVWGSAGVIITSGVVIANKFDHVFNDDDSLLSDADFILSWVFMLISGLFSTLGSLAFVRAFHEDPPMAPLFTWYHVQSDELLASWLFVGATVPFVPYIFLYLTSGYGGLLYIIALVFAVIATLGCLLFVRACYPSDKTHKDILPIVASYLCCCCSPVTRDQYFLNDWLGGSWFFYWGSFMVTFACLALFLQAAAEHDGLDMWVYGTSLVECFAFLVGAAYFVAGSYPDQHTEVEGDSSRQAEEKGEVSSERVNAGQPIATRRAFALTSPKNAAGQQYTPFRDEDDDFAAV